MYKYNLRSATLTDCIQSVGIPPKLTPENDPNFIHNHNPTSHTFPCSTLFHLSLQSIPTPSNPILCTTYYQSIFPFLSKKNLFHYDVHHHILRTISRKRSRHVTIASQRPDVSQIRFRVDDALVIFRLLLCVLRYLPPILSTLLTLPTPSSIHGVSISTLAIFHVGFLLRHELRYVILFIFR